MSPELLIHKNCYVLCFLHRASQVIKHSRLTPCPSPSSNSFTTFLKTSKYQSMSCCPPSLKSIKHHSDVCSRILKKQKMTISKFMFGCVSRKSEESQAMFGGTWALRYKCRLLSTTLYLTLHCSSSKSKSENEKIYELCSSVSFTTYWRLVPYFFLSFSTYKKEEVKGVWLLEVSKKTPDSAYVWLQYPKVMSSALQ
jgi:hypothetical protein